MSFAVRPCAWNAPLEVFLLPLRLEKAALCLCTLAGESLISFPFVAGASALPPSVAITLVDGIFSDVAKASASRAAMRSTLASVTGLNVVLHFIATLLRLDFERMLFAILVVLVVMAMIKWCASAVCNAAWCLDHPDQQQARCTTALKN